MDRGHDYDTLEERYQKLKFQVQQFLAFQIGLVTFKWDLESKKYVSRAFCFYVYPRSKMNDATNLFQVSPFFVTLLGQRSVVLDLEPLRLQQAIQGSSVFRASFLSAAGAVAMRVQSDEDVPV